MTDPDGAPRAVHMISDSTGETLAQALDAALSQFRAAAPALYSHTMIRSPRALDEALAAVEAAPGLVLHTVIDQALRERLETRCRRLRLTTLPLLDPLIGALSGYLNADAANRPGAQHATDQRYYDRMAALDFALAHDDGASAARLREADVVLVGVSRTSKTPTCVYLAGKGVKAANCPLTPAAPPPEALFGLGAAGPLVVGLTARPERLAQIRRNRLAALQQDAAGYADLDGIRREVIAARRLFERLGCTVIDVTRRSVEETAAAILKLLAERAA